MSAILLNPELQDTQIGSTPTSPGTSPTSTPTSPGAITPSLRAEAELSSMPTEAPVLASSASPTTPPIAAGPPVEVKRARPSAAITAAKQSNKHHLDAAIAQHQATSGLKASELAQQKKTYIQKRMFYAGVTKPQRQPNCWNAFIGCKTKEYNEGRPSRERLTAPEYLRRFPAITTEWFSMSKSERKKWSDAGQIAREAKNKQAHAPRTSGLSVLRDANASFAKLREEMMGLGASTGMEIIFMAVRNDACDYQAPQTFATRRADDFLVKRTGKDVNGLAMKLELHVLGMADEDDGVKAKGKTKLRDLRGIARDLIRTGLQEAVSKSHRLPTDRTTSITMDFPHYKAKVVAKYGMELEGWPAGVPFKNPGNIHRVDELDTLCDAIRIGKCYWNVLDDKQFNRRLKVIEAERKKAAAQVRPAKKTKAAKSAEHVESDSDEDGEGSIDGTLGKENGDVIIDRGEFNGGSGSAKSSQSLSALTLARKASEFGPTGTRSVPDNALGASTSSKAPALDTEMSAVRMMQRGMERFGVPSSMDGGIGWGNGGWRMGLGTDMGMGMTAPSMGTGAPSMGRSAGRAMDADMGMDFGMSFGMGMGIDITATDMGMGHSAGGFGMEMDAGKPGALAGEWSLLGIGAADSISGDWDMLGDGA